MIAECHGGPLCGDFIQTDTAYYAVPAVTPGWLHCYKLRAQKIGPQSVTGRQAEYMGMYETGGVVTAGGVDWTPLAESSE